MNTGDSFKKQNGVFRYDGNSTVTAEHNVQNTAVIGRMLFSTLLGLMIAVMYAFTWQGAVSSFITYGLSSIGIFLVLTIRGNFEFLRNRGAVRATW